MSLGIVKYGELLTLNIANRCNGYTGEVVCGMHPTSSATFKAAELPDIFPYYALAFLQELPHCHWSQRHQLFQNPSRWHKPKVPPGAAVYYYYAGAWTLTRALVTPKVKRISVGASYAQMSGRGASEDEKDKAEMEAIFKRQLAEESRQLAAADLTRDRIFREMFGGDR